MGHRRKLKCAVLMPGGHELASRLLTGVHQFMDEQPALGIVELPFVDGAGDMLPAGHWDFAGAVLWTDRSYRWVPRLAEGGRR